jgi:predicted amidophosphoribosyltransferase
MVEPGWDIRCPNCEKISAHTKQTTTFTCDHCAAEFFLRGHMCPSCYSHSSQERGICESCGEALSRLCSHCGRANWPGHPSCYNCGQSLDFFDSLTERHSPSSTADRLNAQMLQAKTLKTIEDVNSQRRMSELQTIEAVRLKKIEIQQIEQEKKDRWLFILAGSVLFIFLLALVIYALFAFII